MSYFENGRHVSYIHHEKYWKLSHRKCTEIKVETKPKNFNTKRLQNEFGKRKGVYNNIFDVNKILMWS